MDVAEETGLLVTIDERAIDRAVSQIVAWTRELPVGGFEGVAVNVTSRHLSAPRFVSVVRGLLSTKQLKPALLAIEITERVLTEASAAALDNLRDLRELGVQIDLDDFGTGYSSLSYLREVPLDFLQIDAELVRSLRADAVADRAVVKAVIELAHALGLWVVAEGVETEEQHAALVELGCDHAQGYLFGPPAEPEHAAVLIGRRGSTL